ncbi:MAG TPA: sigma-70 family RNA polymerase sigma factor [Vicinamibacterales bacterium]|nr:sigma-70 family RNA polymerase sigma factor [Vicinamibacterales bacterium]
MTGSAPASPSGITELLLQWGEGDKRALQKLMPLVYEELRRIARDQLRREVPGQTLEPTTLVHEVYLRFVDQQRAAWHNRAQFFAVAAYLMRRVIVDHARARYAEKRGGSAVHVALQDADEQQAHATSGKASSPHSRTVDMLVVDAALERLAAIDPDQARIVELRFFAGMTVEETAHVLKWSPRTVKREWRLAKAWLYRELGSGR